MMWKANSQNKLPDGAIVGNDLLETLVRKSSGILHRRGGTEILTAAHFPRVIRTGHEFCCVQLIESAANSHSSGCECWSRRACTFRPLILAPDSAAMTSSARAWGTSTIENRSAMSMMPI